MTATHPQIVQLESVHARFEQVRAPAVRGRVLAFFWLCLGGVVIAIVAMLGTELFQMGDPFMAGDPWRVIAIRMLPWLLTAGVLGGAIAWLTMAQPTHREAVRACGWVTVVATGCLLVFSPLFEDVATPAAGQIGAAGLYAPLWGITLILLVPTAAVLLVPLTIGETLAPLLVLLALHGLMTFTCTDGEASQCLLVFAASGLVVLPGVGIFAWRYSHFLRESDIQRLSGEVGLMKRELVSARRIHDSLFPKPADTDSLRFDYRYLPMTQIGGDYLYASLEPSQNDRPGRLSVVVLDVTGHGIGAALTVNRLYGELERLFGERSDIDPGQTLRALNRYVCVVLAKYQLYATAVCLRADPGAGVLEWANAGHPPPFVRHRGQGIRRLEPTAAMLGVFGDEEFDPEPASCPFAPGDTCIAYTDGVTESRGPDGRMLRIDGMHEIIASVNPIRLVASGYADAILREIGQRRFCTDADDTLIVEIARR